MGLSTGGPDGVAAPSALPAEEGAVVAVTLSREGMAAPVDLHFRRASGVWGLVGVDRSARALGPAGAGR
jgi:hypothetical protein